ncbi:DUF4468 domain-containing protein, partial [Aquimarina sp. AD1]|uniref:DUF4468 domain-containing protein n=2 Tax=Aquimarina sp. (strain AD1) TaxID=1714848 RepID=UPI000EAA5CBE
LVLIGNLSYGQSRKTKKMIQEIKKEWSLDENDKISYKRIVEIPELTKKEIYNKVLSFLVENQIENYELITQNDDAGLILDQGVYSGIHNNGRGGMFLVDIDCKYSIKTEIKEGRVR